MMNPAAAALTSVPARWRLVAAALVAALAAAMLAAVPVARSEQLWLVDASASLPAGARIVQALPVADALLVAAPRIPGAVPADTPLSTQTDTFDVETVAEDYAVDAAAEVGADAVWASGVKGAGALVAVVDTGVAPVAALAASVAGEIDFTGTGGGDGYGHGTVVASLIAGDGGIAPEAKILSLKVADEDGNVALVSVLDALQWLHAAGKHSGVGVTVTALGVPSDTKAAEMLDGAVDRLARSGPAVIAPTGNDGAPDLDDTLTSPATAPGAVGVGATEGGEPAAFSGSGADRAGNEKPDVVAPGVHVVGHTPADGSIAQAHPDAMQGPEQIRGAGTSLSAALVAGVAALAVSANAEPAEVASALRLDGAPVDAVTLVEQTKNTAKPVPPGLARRQVADSVAWNGQGWGNQDWNGASLGGVRWTGVRWTGVRWTGVRWTGVRWTDDSWEGVRWTDDSWEGVRWTDESWTGVRWTGVRWTGVRWTGVRWSGVRWTASWSEGG